MATKRSFSVQLDDVGTPQDYSRAGAYVERAGQLEGAAKVTERKADLALAGELFSQGAAAVKGYGEADIAKTSKEAIAKFEDSPENVRGAQVAEFVDLYDRARTTPEEQEQMGVDRGPTTNEDPSVSELRAEARRFRTAEANGLLTRQQVLDRVAGAVKTWSARLPGLQSDFRKAAANETNVSNIDLLSIHQALTTESVREQAAQRALKANEKYVADVAAYRHIPPSAVTQKDMQMFYEHGQLANLKTSAEAKAKVLSLNSETRGRALDGAVAVQNNNNVLTLAEMFSNWDKLNEDPANTKERDLMSVRIQSAVGKMRLTMVDYINTLSAENGVDASPYLDKMDKLYTSYDTLLKTKGGMDMMRQVIGRRKDSVDDMHARFEVMNPILSSLGRMNLTNPTLAYYVEKGHEATARKFSPAIADAYKKFFENSKEWTEGWERGQDPKKVDQHGPVVFDSPEGAHYDQPRRDLQFDGWKGHVLKAANVADLTPQETSAAKAGLHSMLANTRANQPDYLKGVNQVLDHPGMEAFLQTVPVIERKAYAEYVFKNIDTPLRDASEQAQTYLNKINTDPNNKAVEAGWQLEVRAEPDGVLKSVWVRDPKAAEAFRPLQFGPSTLEGAVTGMQKVLDQSTPRFMGESYAGNKARLDTELTKATQFSHTLANGHKVSGDQPEMTRETIGGMVANAVMKTSDLGALSPQEKVEAGVVLRQMRPEMQVKMPPIDMQQVLLALSTAEGTLEGKYLGDSGAGTLGKYQLTEKAVKDVLGKKYDPAKLDWYRLDPVESARIAYTFWAMMYRQLGSVDKATAAYNAGADTVKKAVEAARKDKKPEHWLTYMKDFQSAKNHKETVAYLSKFKKPYAEYQPEVTGPITDELAAP